MTRGDTRPLRPILLLLNSNHLYKYCLGRPLIGLSLGSLPLEFWGFNVAGFLIFFQFRPLTGRRGPAGGEGGVMLMMSLMRGGDCGS